MELLQGQLKTAPLSTMPSEEVLARGAPIRTSELRRQTIGSKDLSILFRFLTETAISEAYEDLEKGTVNSEGNIATMDNQSTRNT